MTPTGAEKVRAPTKGELMELLRELLDYADALHPGDTGALPPGLYLKLRRLIEVQIVKEPWTLERIHLLRWGYVRQALDRDGKGWDEAFEDASKALKGTPAEGSPSTMLRSYNKMQTELPPERQRKRTWTKKQQ